MDFIDFEAVKTDQQNDDLIFSHDEIKDSGKVDDNFIDDTEQETSEQAFIDSLSIRQRTPKLQFTKKVTMKLF